MSSESRQLPQSNVSRVKFFNTASKKNASMGADSILTPKTKTRLVDLSPVYIKAYNDTAPAKQAMVASTERKTIKSDICRMLCSHFVQVFNFGVDRGKYNAADRAFYKIDVNSGAVPSMKSEDDLLLVASNLIDGDAKRVAAGGAPMANPSIDEVTSAYTELDTEVTSHSTISDAYDTALEALDAQNEDADKVIKKIADEVETYYNEEDAASMRHNAVQWGIEYSRTGSTKKITGQTLDKDTNQGIEGVEIYFQNGNKTVESNAEFNYSLNTTLMDNQNLIAVHPLYDDFAHELTLVENEDITYTILMKRKV